MVWKDIEMDFSTFINKLSSAIRAGNSTPAFTKTIFEVIVNEDGQKIVSQYKKSSFKGFYNGHTPISGIAKKINAYLDPSEFVDYIKGFPDAVQKSLCSVFKEDIPDITKANAPKKLAELFVAIITEAAGTTKVMPHKQEEIDFDKPMAFVTDESPNIPDILDYEDGIYYINRVRHEEDEPDPFEKYLSKAKEYYSLKKTLLYAEKPRPFYDIYVCNSIRYHRFRVTGARDPKPEITINDATVSLLENESKYIIIEGTGGIGKSMFLTHLFLSSVGDYSETGKIPVFIPLKDYREGTANIVDFIWSTIKAFDAGVEHSQIVLGLENKNFVLLMDGMDEVQSSLREAFDADLEAFNKSYPGNTVIITSRPVNAFVSYAKFSLFDLLPLSKAQSISLAKKLDFWDTEAKANFIEALDHHLYRSHTQFASNPLLLTIMLMTYSSFGEVPAKMHVFYSKAYETMARLHDASKGSFKRPLHTKLSPEEFAKYFSEFCARTYTKEILEFDERTFALYMEKVLEGTRAKQQGVTPRDFLLDLTDNLCIMYREGDTIYFIHRSFQEYFAAVYFASDYDERLPKVGKFFEKQHNRSYSDRTFDMLYDMIPEKVERYIFLPYLQDLIENCESEGESEEYWAFLELQYPAMYHEEGETGESYCNTPQSFLYEAIVREKNLSKVNDLDQLEWPEEINELPRRDWVTAYVAFLDCSGYEKNPDPEAIDPRYLEDITIVAEDELPYQYSNYFGDPDIEGHTIEIEVYELRKNPRRYEHLRSFIESPAFPLVEEYCSVKEYYADLKSKTQKEIDSDNLFDD